MPDKPSYSCVMADMPQDAVSQFLKMVRDIGDDDIAVDDDGESGRVLDPHVTVLYGLHTTEPKDVLDGLDEIPEIKMEIQPATIFPANENRPESDCIVFPVKSDDLIRLNQSLRKLPHSSDYPDYKPHLSLAYVKAGRGEKFKGLKPPVNTVTTSMLRFSPPDDAPDSRISLKEREIIPMPHTLHEPTVSKARGAISRGEIDDGEWSAPNQSERKQDECLGSDMSYPIFKGEKVSRKALSSAQGRANEMKDTAIEDAAKSLGELCDKKADEGKSIGLTIVKLSKKNPYGDCTGPLGFPMLSKLAQEAESALKKQSRDIRSMFKATVVDADGKKYDVDGYQRLSYVAKDQTFSDGEHADISVVTSDCKDRDGDIVLAKGFSWDQFRKNPVVPFAHNYSAPPVGKSQWITIAKVGDGEGWKAKTVYIKRPGDHPADAPWFPDTVYHFIKEGMMPGKSVGFIPMGYREPTPQEVKDRPDWKDGNIIDESLGLEYSPVPVPANQDALCESVAKAFKGGFKIAKEFLDAMGMVIPTIKDEGDGMMDSMPMCPKCNNNADVQPVADYDAGDGPALYRCMKCGLHFHGDLESPALQSSVQNSAPSKPFTSPETIRRAIQRKLAGQTLDINSIVDQKLNDRLMRELGRP